MAPYAELPAGGFVGLCFADQEIGHESAVTYGKRKVAVVRRSYEAVAAPRADGAGPLPKEDWGWRFVARAVTLRCSELMSLGQPRSGEAR